MLSLYFCPVFAQQSPEPVLAEPYFQPAIYPQLEININKISQDSSGFIWFGTDQGLIRFDGYQTRTFIAGKSETELSNNVIWDMVEDPRGNLWISTYGGGLNKFDPLTEQFTQFKRQTSISSISSDALWDIEIRDDSHLWIGSRNWLNSFNLDDQVNQRLSPSTTPSLKIDNNVWAIHQSADQILWIGTLGEGLYRYNPKDHSLQQFAHDKNNPKSLSNNLVRSISQDGVGNLWIATDNGLNRLDITSGTVTRFKHENGKNSLPGNELNKVFVDSRGQVWIGTFGAGLSLYQPHNQTFLNFSFDSLGLDASRKPQVINDIYEDRQGILWFATNKGPLKLNPVTLQIKRLQLPGDEATVVNAVERLDDGKIWAAFNKRLIQYAVPSMRLLQSIELPDVVNDLSLSPQGSLWVATNKSGLFQYSADGEPLAHYGKHDNGILPGNHFYSLLAQSNQRLWLGLYRSDQAGGLVLFEPQKGQFKRFFDAESIIDIEQLDERTLLLATNKSGVIKFDTQTFEHQMILSTDNLALNFINDIFISSEGHIYLATEGAGLAQLSLEKQSILPILSSLSAVSWITEDSRNTLWIAADSALFEYQPSTQTINKYDGNDGLAVRKSANKSLLFNDGQMIFGTDEGMVFFNPEHLGKASQSGKIQLTELKLFNQPQRLSTEQQATPLKLPLRFSDKLTLSYQDYLFSLVFSAMDFRYPEQLSYRYQLKGFDQRWIHTNALNRVATFSNIPSGTYTFNVQAIDRQNRAISDTSSITIEITPPWWQSNIAYLAWTLLTIALIYLLIHLRTASLQRQARTLEQGIKDRTEQLEQKTATIASLLQQKRRMFSNISHEFRTPLTLIIGPVKQLLQQQWLPAATAQLQTIERNGQRLLQMVEQLLILAKLDTSTPQKQRQYALMPIIKSLVTAFQPLAQEKNQTLKISNSVDASVQSLPDSLEIILTNLLTNAIKYTPDGGNIEVQVTCNNGQAHIAVCDNGIGIETQYQQSIFERFNRGSHDNNEQIGGAGVGLALVKELVQLNDAQIQLHSQPGQGSRFELIFPLADAQDSTPTNDNAINPALALLTPTDIQPRQQELQLPTASEDCPLVLIVEDNPDMRAHLLSLLHHDYRCIQAENGLQGLQLASEHVPDIIICDVMMPQMDGFEFSEKLKQQDALCHIPIILLTAKADSESRKQGLLQHVDDYMTKPFDSEELLLKLQNLLVIRSILRKRFGNEIHNNPAGLLALKQQLNEKDQAFVSRFEQLIASRFHDSEFQLNEAAEQLAMSDRQLQRKLKAIMDQKFSEYLRSYRLRQAKELLQQGLTSAQLIESIGFSSPSYFANCFKAEFDQTPKQFQQSILEKQRSSVN